MRDAWLNTRKGGQEFLGMSLITLGAANAVGTLEILPAEAAGGTGAWNFGHRYIELNT